MTRLVREKRDAMKASGIKKPRQIRILNCMGMRAQESPARAKKPALSVDERASNGYRHVDAWLPIHHWTEAQVWKRIAAEGIEIHPAYGMGMPRLSCSFCVLASRGALVLAAQLRPALAQDYVRVEIKTGHRFRNDLSMVEIVAEARSAPPVTAVEDWAA